MGKKRPAGVTVFCIFVILGALYQLAALPSSQIKLLYQPLSERMIQAHTIIAACMLLAALVSAAGVLFLRDIFRKVLLVTAFYNICQYLVEGPFIFFRNTGKFIDQSVGEAAAKAPAIPAHVFAAVLWAGIIIGWVIDFGFTLALVYYFTRPAIKARFTR